MKQRELIFKEKKMKDNISAIKNKMTPVRLRLELKDEFISYA